MKHLNEEEILESLNGMNSAELSPYFQNRVLAKWKSTQAETNMGKWVPALACALLFLLFVSNLRLFLQSNIQTKKTMTDTEHFTQTYFLPSNQTIYEIDMEQ